MYAFLTGPALWVTFIIFIGGLIVRVAFLAGLSRERDRVFYNHAERIMGMAFHLPLAHSLGKCLPPPTTVFCPGISGVSYLFAGRSAFFERAQYAVG